MLFKYFQHKPCYHLHVAGTNENGAMDICFLPLNRGNRRLTDQIEKRWFYNVSEEKCEWFLFLVSGGNENNFRSEENCKKICMQNVK